MNDDLIFDIEGRKAMPELLMDLESIFRRLGCAESYFTDTPAISRYAVTGLGITFDWCNTEVW